MKTITGLGIAELRSLLRDMIGVRGYPQLVLRMGYAPDVRPSLRRRRG